MEQCPCGTGTTYDACCGIYITGKATAPTPEKLMRSRYTAYTQANIDYIAKTMKGAAMRDFNADTAKRWAEKVEWERLDVCHVSDIKENIGFVEFLVYFRENGKRHALHETSEFHLENGHWYYVDGRPPKQRPAIHATLIKRNEPCPCGSEKKYKKCCGFRD